MFVGWILILYWFEYCITHLFMCKKRVEFMNDKGDGFKRKEVELDVLVIANWLISFFVKLEQSLEFVYKIG